MLKLVNNIIIKVLTIRNVLKFSNEVTTLVFYKFYPWGEMYYIYITFIIERSIGHNFVLCIIFMISLRVTYVWIKCRIL